MGTMTFLLPPGMPADAVQELHRASVAGGPDGMPYPTEVTIASDRLVVRRNVDESGYLLVPWNIEGAGRLMTASPTLIERDDPYQIQIELARGKVNQLRNQAADWLSGGLLMPEALEQDIRDATLTFARAVTAAPRPGSGARAQSALAKAFDAADELVQIYKHQVFQVRHQKQARLDTGLACRLAPVVPTVEQTDLLVKAFNTISLPFAWSDIQPTEEAYQWQAHDDVLAWAQKNELPVAGGPVVDFTPARLPDWLWLWERDLPNLVSLLCTYVETVIRRYRGRIRNWQLTTASNAADVLGLGEDELLWLTVRLAEAARQVDPGLELSVGIAQPWGEYMALQDHTHSPFIFADTLIRSGMNLAALDLELILGVSPRGSYSRDALEVSRLIDLYALLGVPLQVTLGYPSAAGPDPQADPALAVDGGSWRGGFTPDSQAEWAELHVGLALCKPAVRTVTWAHFLDGAAHQFPGCGLVDAAGKQKPAVKCLQNLREQHLT
jgi:Glycosyl hydrolase family 10